MTDRPTIRLTAVESTSPPGFPPYRGGAPNVVMVVLDDLGFSQLGCFGSDLDTPAFDALAAGGLRFTNFHTTALCSPTRACLLTGRNHHRIGLGFLPDVPMRFPGYTGRIPPEAGMLSEVLLAEGWATRCIGKWHLTPRDERTPAGPFDQWPVAKGFERYYGFLGGDTNHWTPDLVRDNTPVEPPYGPDDGYHLTADLVDESIGQIRELRATQPERPFFLWFAAGCAHAPHHVPREWIERYRGRFDDGWDAWRDATLTRQKQLGILPEHVTLSERPRWVDAWDSLTADQHRVYARMMEVFAGFVSHTDAQIGRLVAELERLGELDNTVFMVVSDNGASAEGGPHGSVNELRFIAGLHEDLELNLKMIDELGGPRSYGHYPWGWALAGNTPLRRWKRYTWEGGVRDPLILHWPAGIADRGGLRHHYTHAIDVMPTVLDACGVGAPARLRGVEQLDLDGVSLRPVLESADAADVRTTQYYEMWGSRAIYHQGWKAVTDHVNQQHPGERDLTDGSTDFRTDRWLLFDTRTDVAEVHDVADQHPETLQELINLWFVEAGRNGVLPLDDGIVNRFGHMDMRWLTGRGTYELLPGTRLHEEAGPMLLGTNFAMVAELAGHQPGDEGVLCEQGDWTNGWAWFVQGGRCTWVLNYVGESVHRVTADVPVGTTRLGFTWTCAEGGGAHCRLLADDGEIGSADIPVDIPFRWNPNGAFLTVGFGRGFPVCDDYQTPFRYSGELERVVIEVANPLLADPEADLDALLRHQ